MAEIVFQKRRPVPVLIESNPLIIILIIYLIQSCSSQVINRAPHFVPQIGDMSQFSVPEDTMVGIPVYHIKGIDPENTALRYSISGQHFTVDPLTGVVTLAKSLDREQQATLEVIISITDEGIADTEPNTVSLRRVVRVRDVNDNAPQFTRRPYAANISESAPPGTEILVEGGIVVVDADEGTNAEIHITCRADNDREACDKFSLTVHMTRPNEYLVRIFVSEPLDYETRAAYVLLLEAADRGLPPKRTVASVAITVRDEQDTPPVFLNAPYSATLPENTPPDTSILEIVARDGDTLSPRTVALSVEGDASQHFTLRGTTLVTTTEPVDRESEPVASNGGVYNVYVKATELINNEVPSDYTVAQVTLIVTDVDDHLPAFTSDVYNVSIPENIDNGSPLPGLSIYVQDDDIGQNSKYELKLRDVFNSAGVFSLLTDYGEGKTPISIVVKDSSKLNYDVDDDELRNFSFDIVASSNAVELSSARVNIKLLDQNDNAPVFDETYYKFNVLENAIIGQKIGDVHATDKDYGIFGTIEYSLNGFGSNLFSTDKENGGLFVAQTLDYEKQKSYSLTVIAKDGGGKVSTTSVFVDVVDVNDNAPVFEQAEYSRTIRDGASSFEPQFVVHATDLDGETQGGGRVYYSLLTDNSITAIRPVFSVDPSSGEITILDRVHTMDTPRGQYDLVVRATDYGIPPLHSDTRVSIRVGVAGNQRPTFIYHHASTHSEDVPLYHTQFSASVKETAAPGENVTLIRANDPDGLDELITYRIVSGANDNFQIHEKTGLITVSEDAHLDRDHNPDHYEVVVSAVDGGSPIPETATTTVLVNVIDVNDKPPKFSMPESSTYISEKTKIGSLVTQLLANDTDLNSKLKYSLIQPVKALSKAGTQLKQNTPYEYKTLFRIDEDTGEIFVNGTLDYSQASIVILTIRVTDKNAEVNKDTQYDTAEHTIYIQPHADKNPQFTNPGWTSANPVIYTKIQEDQPIGSTVLVITAEDPISGHLISNFKVINAETGLLQVDPLSGQVVLTRNLDYEELSSPNLTLTVKAASNDGSKYSTAKIIIEVLNINDNIPIFEKELYKVSLLESIAYPEIVVQVKATDNDAVLIDDDKLKGYSDVIYSLKGENTELFIIDNITGIIQIASNKSLDRERQSVLRLEVVASDTPASAIQRLSSTVTLLIDVIDVDDNAPVFEKQQYIGVIAENAPIGASVMHVSAIDADEGVGGEITYDLHDEGDAHGFFLIDPSSGEIRTKRDLTGRGRTEPYRLLIRATDGGGHTGDTSLLLYIGDVSANDGVPRFIRPAKGENLSVSENATIGSPIYQVVASDPDDPAQPSGQLYYSIQQTNVDAQSFNIDPKSGLLSTKKSLDRERLASYTLVLQVTDRGQPPQQSTRIVTVLVEDVDDHKPHFARALDDGPLVMRVLEESPIGTLVGELQAVDEDIGLNAAIDYAIIAGNDQNLLKVQRTDNNTALISIAAKLDREVISHLLLTIKCYKFGEPPPKNKPYNRLNPSEIQMLVKIVDIDDHLPEFESDTLSVSVRINAPPRTVVAKVRAKDRDPDASTPQYTLVNGTFHSPIAQRDTDNITDVIALDSDTGELSIIDSLMHYADGIFRLQVRANNSEDPDRYSDMLVELGVVRERDLLRMAADGVRSANELRDKLGPALAQKGLRMQLHDMESNIRPGWCFQLRKLDSGDALLPTAGMAAIRSLDSGLRLTEVTSCAEPHRVALLTVAQRSLLALSAVLTLAALVAALVLCCMHSRAVSRSRSPMLLAAPPTVAASATSLYARPEPLYDT